MTLRVVVIGTGFGARVVAPVFAATAGCEVVEVVSARDASAIRAAITEERADLVSIHSPPFLHDEHVRAAIEAGARAVLCDKPFALTPDAGRDLLELAGAAGVQHFVNFEFRYDPARLALRQWLQGGAIGPLQHVSWVHLSAGSRVPLRPHGWLFDDALGGGWIGAWGSHAIDALRWLTSEELDVVACTLRTDITERPNAAGDAQPSRAEDGFAAHLRTRTTHIGIAIDSSFAAGAPTAARILASGPEGVIEDIDDHRLVLRRGDGTRDEWRAAADDAGDRHLAPMRAWAATVRDCITERLTPPGVPTFADGLACDEVRAALVAAGTAAGTPIS